MLHVQCVLHTLYVLIWNLLRFLEQGPIAQIYCSEVYVLEAIKSCYTICYLLIVYFHARFCEKTEERETEGQMKKMKGTVLGRRHLVSRRLQQIWSQDSKQSWYATPQKHKTTLRPQTKTNSLVNNLQKEQHYKSLLNNFWYHSGQALNMDYNKFISSSWALQ